MAHGLLDTSRMDHVKILSDISVWWHVTGVTVIAVVLSGVPPNSRGCSGAFDRAPPGVPDRTGAASMSVCLFALGWRYVVVPPRSMADA